MKIKPCVPKDWNNFEVTFKWKKAVYNIKYEKMENKELEELEYSDNQVKMYLNGESVDEIKLKDEGTFEVKVLSCFQGHLPKTASYYIKSKNIIKTVNIGYRTFLQKYDKKQLKKIMNYNIT